MIFVDVTPQKIEINGHGQVKLCESVTALTQSVINYLEIMGQTPKNTLAFGHFEYNRGSVYGKLGATMTDYLIQSLQLLETGYPGEIVVRFHDEEI